MKSSVSSLGLRAVAVCLLAAALTGCVSTRDVVAPRVDAGVNPAQGVPVRIGKVEDLRVFQVKPPSPVTPSLMDDQIHNEPIRARAFSRKRNSYGMALGDVLLPDGQTVAKLVETAVARSLREGGYRVVSGNDADYARATPIMVRIDKLWTWQDLTPMNGGWVTNYDVSVTDPAAPSQPPLVVTGDLKADPWKAGDEGQWGYALRIGLEEISAKLRAKLVRQTSPVR